MYRSIRRRRTCSTQRALADSARERSFVNTARGGIVVERALQHLLETGHLAGAALDVLAAEPPQDLELIRLPNVMTTPHIGGSSEEAILAMGRAAIAGLEREADGGVAADAAPTTAHHEKD